MDVTLPLGPLAGLFRKMLPPTIEFGAAVQRARTSQESFLHIPVWVHPLLLRTIGPATLPFCRAHLDLYSGDTVVRTLPLCWSDMQNAEPPQHEIILRRYQAFLLPIAWRSENEEGGVGYFADARFLRDEKTRLNPITDKSRFRLRVVSGSSTWKSPHFYLARCPGAGASNGLFGVEIEFEGEGSRADPLGGASTLIPAAGPLQIIYDQENPRCVRPEITDDGRAITRYWVGVHNRTTDRTLFDVSLRALEGSITSEIIGVAHGKFLSSAPNDMRTEREPIIAEWKQLDPDVTEYVQLFGLDDEVSASAESALADVRELNLEARATNTKRAIALLEYVPNQIPAIRVAGVRK